MTKFDPFPMGRFDKKIILRLKLRKKGGILK